ncbi:unnamed protein product [marine sediment metagenome]|uniref:Uncharacterized protein n=1 Tax=marine sediment metagenome TaxID=412755 RepID=X1EZZ5_9ZZZZ
MPNWQDYKGTVSPESWKRIELYVEDAQDQTELSDYPSVSSWREMVSVLCMHENGLAIDSIHDELIEDYKIYLEALE